MVVSRQGLDRYRVSSFRLKVLRGGPVASLPTSDFAFRPLSAFRSPLSAFASIDVLEVALQPLLVAVRRLAARIGADGVAQLGRELGEPRRVGELFFLVVELARIGVRQPRVAALLRTARDARRALLL